MAIPAGPSLQLRDYPYFRRMWMRVLSTLLVVAYLPIMVIGGALLGFHVSSVKVLGAAFFICMVLITFALVRITNDLIRRLEAKRRNLKTLDHQLRQTSYLAASMELSQVYFHEVKDTLANIESVLALLVADIEMADFTNLSTSVSDIKAEALRGRQSVDRFLRFIQPEPPLIRDVDLHQVLDDLVDILERSLRFKQIVVERDYQAIPSLVRSDRSKVRQVFQNIVLNAVNAMHKGGCLVISTQRSSDGLSVAIHDSGPGLSDSELKHIFEPLWIDRKKGIGVGLPLCRAILERIGGKIAIESSAEQGTTIAVTLPARFIAKTADEPDDSECL